MLFYLYTALLVGGGRGPFALHAGFWSCHCNDSSLPKESASPEETLQATLQTTLKGSESGGNSAEFARAEREEICHALPDRSMIAEEEASKSCPTKLPLRYITLLLVNSHMKIPSRFHLPGKPYAAFSSPTPERDFPIPGGASLSLLRPPSA